MIHILKILYGASLPLGSALALGDILMRLLGIRLRRVERQVFAFLAGSALLSLAVFLLAAIHAATPEVFQVLTALLISIALWRARGIRDDSRDSPLSRTWLLLFLTAFLLYGGHYLINALAPEASPDGAGYHLEIVGEYARNSGLVRIPTNMYASLSQGMEMLFLMAYSVGGHPAAATVHFWFLLALPLLLLCYGTRFGFPKVGVFAAILVFASPLVGIDGVSAYNDVALAVAAFGVFYLLQLWDEQKDWRLLLLIGLLAGFCYALKYTGALVTPYAIAFVVWRRIRSKKAWVGAAIAVGASALLLIAPWLIKNWLWTGNPLAPFYNSIFPNPYFTILGEIQYKEYLRQFHDGGTSRLKGLLDVTLSGQLSDGLIGPVFLLTPIALLALRYRHGRRLLLAALVFLPAYWSNVGGRFLIPLLPFVSMALGLALANTAAALQALIVFHLIFSWYGVVPIYAGGTTWRISSTPLRAALGRDETAYITWRQRDYPIARMLDKLTPPGSVIFTPDSVPQAYTTRRTIVPYQSAAGKTLWEIFRTPMNPDLKPALRYRFPFFRQPVRGLRVVQVGPANSGEWRVTEFRVYSEGEEVPRRPDWCLRAKPNPWGVQLAFDNSYVTKWAAGEPNKPGMMIEVTFNAPLMADEVSLEAEDGQAAQLQVEGLDEEGEWSPLTGTEFQRFRVHELRGLRAAAMEEFKARGVRYFLIRDRAYGAMDFWANAQAWGITEIGERNATRLYRID